MIANEPRAPYSLEPNVFPLAALAALAGRAPLGGQRETALACFVVGRLIASTRDPGASGSEHARDRVISARHWLAAAALPAPLKQSLTRAAECALDGDLAGTKTALDSVMTVTANQLDEAARLELVRLAQAVVK